MLIGSSHVGMMGRKPDRQKAYLGYQSSTGSGTSYTATISNFGGVAPTPTRIVVAQICTRLTAQVSAVTINGISATLYAVGGGAGNVDYVAFAVAVVPSGTGSFNIAVTTSGTYEGIAVAAWCFDGLDSNTPYAYAYAAASTITVSTVPNNSYTLVGVNCRSEVGSFSGTLGLTNRTGVKYFSDRSAAWGDVDTSTGGSSKTATYSYAFTSYEAINYITFK